MKIEVNLGIFNKKYRILPASTARQIYMWGGASSGKSYSIAQTLTMAALSGEAVLAARQTKVSLRQSVWLEFKNAIATMGLSEYFVENKTELTFTSTISLGSIQLVGAEYEDRVKSVRPIKQSAFSKLWIEEVSEVSKYMVAQLNIRLRGQPVGDFKKQSFYSWNPTYESHYLNKDILEPLGITDKSDVEYRSIYNEDTEETEELMSIHSTYLDNEYLSKEDISYLEKLKEFSPYHYMVYALGRWGVIGERCFENIELVDTLPDISHLPAYAGLDIGWTDPTAFTFMRVDKVNRIIYMVDEFSKSKLDHHQIFDKIKTILIRQEAQTTLVYADSEDPRIIKQLKSLKLSIKAAKKPPGSVLNGIMVLNTFTIVVPKRLRQLYNEIMNYVFEEDKKTGRPSDKPSHAHSHTPDSMRYGLERVMSGNLSMVGKHVKY